VRQPKKTHRKEIYTVRKLVIAGALTLSAGAAAAEPACGPTVSDMLAVIRSTLAQGCANAEAAVRASSEDVATQRRVAQWWLANCPIR
jgi:hypothetical protein